MQFNHSDGSVCLRADTLDEAVKAYNEERVEHRMSTHKITAEHRAVVEEMQRRRKLFVAERRSAQREARPTAAAAAPSPHAQRSPPRLPPRERRDRPARPAPRRQSPVVTRGRSAPTPNPEPVKKRSSSGSSGSPAEAAAVRGGGLTAPGGLGGKQVELVREQVIGRRSMNKEAVLRVIAQRAHEHGARGERGDDVVNEGMRADTDDTQGDPASSLKKNLRAGAPRSPPAPSEARSPPTPTAARGGRRTATAPSLTVAPKPMYRSRRADPPRRRASRVADGRTGRPGCFPRRGGARHRDLDAQLREAMSSWHDNCARCPTWSDTCSTSTASSSSWPSSPGRRSLVVAPPATARGAHRRAQGRPPSRRV